MPLTADHKKIAREMRFQTFMKSLTPRGSKTVNERLWAFDRCPTDPKFIKCTFLPGEGWDLTEREATHFIHLMDGDVTSILYQPGLGEVLHELDACDYIWIGFQ